MEQELDIYLDKIDRRLRPMSASERADIVREIRSEMLELEGRGLASQDIVRRLGAPKDLAAAYLESAIVRNPRFSWSRLGAMAAFYSMAGLAGMIVLPTTTILAAALMLSGALVPAAALLSLLASFAGIEVPWVVIQLGGWIAPPLLAFPIAAAAGALLLLGGMGCWKAAVWFVRQTGKKRQALLHSRNS